MQGGAQSNKSPPRQRQKLSEDEVYDGGISEEQPIFANSSFEEEYEALAVGTTSGGSIADASEGASSSSSI